MPKKKKVGSRRQYSDEFKAEAVQMLLDGHSTESVASRLGRQWDECSLSLEIGSDLGQWPRSHGVGDSRA
jgi:hypothetical protein